MSADIVVFKFLVQENGKPTGDIRRVALKAPVALATLRSAAMDILAWPDVAFHFQDDDGDNVTLASQHELDTAVSLARGGPVRLTVCRIEAEPAPAEPAAPAPAAAEPAAAPAPAEPVAAAPAAAAAAPVDLLSTAPDATIPENVMVQFSAIAEFFQRMAQQMAEFAPRIPVIVNEGIRKMSDNMSKNFTPLDVTVAAAQGAPVDGAGVPAEGSCNAVVHRLPETVVHPGVECAHCHKKPVTGMRYKCVQCDCDLCQDCVFLPGVHTEGHRFLPICAPAVGSHIVQSANEACQSVRVRAAPVIQSAGEMCQNMRARAAPVVQSVKTAVEGAAAEVSDQFKKQVESVKQQVASAPAAAAAPAPAPAPAPAAAAPDGLTDKQREMLQQLNDMGFTDREQLIPLIKKYKELRVVVEHLIN